LAEYIQLNEKTVIRMAQNGELPGKKIGNQWRFSLMTIENYLQDTIIHSSNNDLELSVRSEEQIFPLSRLTDISLINLNLFSKNQEEVLSEIAEIAYTNGLTPSADRLCKELTKREKMLSTAVGDSIAIPHPRNPTKALFQKPNMLICRSKKGVQFFAPDNKKVCLFFLLCAPDVSIHLRLLSKISGLLKMKNIVQNLMQVNDPEDAIKILLEFERQSIYPQRNP